MKKRSSTNHINQSAHKKVVINSLTTLIEHRLFTIVDESSQASNEQTNKEKNAETKLCYYQNMKQNVNVKMFANLEFFNQMNINDSSHSENIFATQSNITLNDVKISDSQSEYSVEFFEKYASVYSENVNAVEMSVKLAKLNISNFCLALSL
jgi:hypothetical protein